MMLRAPWKHQPELSCGQKPKDADVTVVKNSVSWSVSFGLNYQSQWGPRNKFRRPPRLCTFWP